ncbi:MAG: DUF362 domain-containing protein, partial [Atopobiaceae bacterium]|nr:DUF362 domain-containing protein [Atopobiaceae bacterium]
MAVDNAKPDINGDVYQAPEKRDGEQSVVFFTRDLSADGLRKAVAKVAGQLEGKVAIKLHTGEQHGPNIIPREWVAELVDKDLPGATIVETNTFYAGDRDTTEKHLKTLEVNGWTFCPVDITDDEGPIEWPVEGGKWFGTMAVGAHLANYDSMLTLTHFKGHTMGGFGGSNKNIGIGCATGKEGKKWIHQREGSDDMWSIDTEELMERITESTKATIDHFGERVVYVNVMRNMSVSCDCEGTAAAPVVTPNVGILASLDICAIDSACVDLVMTMTEEGLVHNHDLQERMTTRHGFRQLEYMHELGMGNWKYQLVDLDNNEAEV